MSDRNARFQPLFNGLFLSLIWHASLLLFFADFSTWTVTVLPQGTSARVDATLRSETRKSASLNDAKEVPDVPEEVRKPRVQERSLAYKDERSAKTPYSPVPSNEHLVETTLSVSPVRGASQEISISAQEPLDLLALNQDGLREYRLNLGREARRYKRYPALARERGLEGVVVLVISTTAGVVIPQVSLGNTSGHAVLDAQALEMAILAVRFANLPQSLHGRDFALDLPVRFSLEE
jgi:TonB family protein